MSAARRAVLQHIDEAHAEQKLRRCDDEAGGCGRSAEEGAVLRDGSALCEACKEGIAEAEFDDAEKLREAYRLVRQHKAAERAKQRLGLGLNVVSVQALAEAFHAVGKLNHYMVGVVFDFSDEELDAAEQILIDRQNAGPQKGKAFQALERALDEIEAEREKRRRERAEMSAALAKFGEARAGLQKAIDEFDVIAEKKRQEKKQ